MKRTFVMGMVLVTIAAGLVANAPYSFANRDRPVLLIDRLPEFDAVVLGTVKKAVIKAHENGDGQYHSVLTIQVDEAFVGNVEVGDEVELVVGAAPLSERTASLVLDGYPIGETSVWYLRNDVSPRIARFRAVARTRPHNDEWQEYLAPLRERANQYQAYDSLRLVVQIDAASIDMSLPFQVTVLLSGRDNDIKMPIDVPLSWRSHLALVMEEDDNKGQLGFEPNSSFAPPLTMDLLNFRPIQGEAIPVTVEAGRTYGARLAARIVGDLEVGSSRDLRIVAKLVAPNGRTLVYSRSNEVRVVQRELAEGDLNAIAEITQMRLWPLIGPHVGNSHEGQVNALRSMYAKYSQTTLGPAIECGLVFADADMPLDDRVDGLRRLAKIRQWGWSSDCLAKAYELLLMASRQAEAHEVRMNIDADDQVGQLMLESTSVVGKRE